MNNLKLYCPKCGNGLTFKCEHSNQPLYECVNKNCNYSLEGINTIDISFKSKGIAKALSNLCPYPFTFGGVYCASMESFIQSLKVKDVDVQEDICSKAGPFCYSIRTMWDDWRETQTVFWKGAEYDRQSSEYIDLLKKAYFELFCRSPIFRYALKESKPYKLIHSIGCTDKKETLLTPDEYISILEWLRELPPSVYFDIVKWLKE